MYHDMKSTIQDAFIAAEKFNRTKPDEDLLLMLLGTDQLERLFSVIRTMTHAKNCDLLELLDRYQLASSIEKVFQKHPEWKSNDRLTIRETLDHSSPFSPFSMDWFSDK